MLKQRHAGREIDTGEMTNEDAKVLENVTAWWKANRGWMMKADVLRLDADNPSLIVEQQNSVDGDRFVVFAGRADMSTKIVPRPQRLAYLDPRAIYEIELVNKDDIPELSRGDAELKEGKQRMSGSYLMNFGITLPWDFPQIVWVVEGKKVREQPSQMN